MPLAEFTYINNIYSLIKIILFIAGYIYNPRIYWELKDKSLEGRIPTISNRVKLLYKIRDKIIERLRRA